MFWRFKVTKMSKVVSPETGNEFSSGDVASGFTALFTLCFLLSRARKYLCALENIFACSVQTTIK